MSKLVATNSKKKYRYLVDKFYGHGFLKLNEYVDGCLGTCFFKKLKLDNENVIDVVDGFIGVNGTFIYKGVKGREALALVFEDKNRGVEYIRANAIGNYCLVIKDGELLTFFTDPGGIYNMYYYKDDNDWLVTNTYYHIAQTLDDIVVNKKEALELSFQYAILGNKTPFEGVYKLQGDEYISIDIKKDDFSIRKIKPITGVAYSTCSHDFSKNLVTIAGVIGSNYDSLTISMTGGLDSRLNLSAFLANNIKPKLVYGIGNSILTNTKNKDLEINEIYREHFDLDLDVLDWSNEIDFPSNWEELLDKYGELFLIYSGNKNFFKSFDDSVRFEYITFGYFGEMLRNIDWIDEIKSDEFTLNQFVSLYVKNNIPFERSVCKKHFNNIYRKFDLICQSENIDSLKITKQDFTKIHYHYRKNADAKLCNLMNLLGYSSIILSEPKLLNPMLNYDYSKKLDARFMLKILHKTYEEILNIPFYSHGKDMKFDSKTFKLETIDKPIRSNNIVLYLKMKIKMLGIYTQVRNVYKTISKYRDKPDSKEKKQIINIASNYLDTKELYEVNRVNLNSDIRALVAYAQLSYMIDKIRNQVSIK